MVESPSIFWWSSDVWCSQNFVHLNLARNASRGNLWSVSNPTMLWGEKNAKHLWRSRFGRLKESARVRPRPLHQRLHESLPPKRNDCRVAPLFPRKKISSRWIGRGGSCELGSSSCYFERFILAVAFCGCSLELSPGAVLSPPCLTPAIVANRKNIRAVTCWHVWALIFANEWLIVFYS